MLNVGETSTSKSGEWKRLHLKFEKGEFASVIGKTEIIKAVGMTVDVIGEGTIWLDNPEIQYSKKWIGIIDSNPDYFISDPEINFEIANNENITLIVGNNKNVMLPYVSKLTKLHDVDNSVIDAGGHSIFIHADEENLYFDFNGPSDETLFVELGGYVGNASYYDNDEES